MMFKKTVLALATMGLMSAAYAAPFYINLDSNRDGDSNTTTGLIDQLGFTGTLATSIYLGNPTVSGTNVDVIDTNLTGLMSSYGFGSLSGSNGFVAPTDTDVRNIDALNFVTVPNQPTPRLEGFQQSAESYGNTAVDGKTWGLVYDYVLYGKGNIVDGALFGGGYFDIFYTESPTAATRTQVGRLNVIGSNFSVGSGFTYDIFGNLSFDWDGIAGDDTAGNTFVQNFFIDESSGKSFYQRWKDGDSQPMNLAVKWSLDTNIDCAKGQAPADNLCGVSSTTYTDDQQQQQTAYMRQTKLDGSIAFQVPEPASLALLGIGFLGLGMARRRKNTV